MKIVLYIDKKGEYRWRMVARNGRTIADSSEGYKKKAVMMRTVNTILTRMSWGFTLVDKTVK